MYSKNYTVYVDTAEDLARLGHVLDDLGLDVDMATGGEVSLSLDPNDPFSYVSFQIAEWS
jgi:hypothetical protein